LSERRILVKLHARASELAGAAEADVSVGSGASCAAVKRQLAERHPALAGLLASCALATDAEFLADDAPVGDAASLHLIPPVSGG
jgi:molybdopterin converting factor small subunit